MAAAEVSMVGWLANAEHRADALMTRGVLRQQPLSALRLSRFPESVAC